MARGKSNPYRKNDAFTDRAKKAGYPARRVFKLEEIDQRVKLLRPGQHVLDLGASPGSWSLYVASKIGPQGRLLAVDLQPLRTQLPPSNSEFVLGDALTLDDAVLGRFAPYDVVVSDMAPSTSGNKMADQARSFELFMRALAVAERYTAEGGTFVGKIFMGADFPEARAAVKKVFAKERLIRPESVRAVSFEIFVIGSERCPRPEAEGGQ